MHLVRTLLITLGFAKPMFCNSVLFTNPTGITKMMIRGSESIYLHRSGPLLENGLDKPKNRYGGYGFPSFYSISISTVGVDGARVCL